MYNILAEKNFHVFYGNFILLFFSLQFRLSWNLCKEKKI